MKHLNLTVSRTLSALTSGLADPCAEGGQSSRVVGAATDGRPYKRLCVERIGVNLYSLAHYGEMNGDAMRDPEMTFLLGADGRWYPVYFRNDYVGREDEAADVDPIVGTWTWTRPRMQASMVEFATLWLGNLAEQQGAEIRLLARKVG